jgi:hypothetical protein
MNVNDLEDIVSRVSLEYFQYKNPGFSAAENPNTVHTCIDDTAFIINRFIKYFNELAEEQLDD